MKTKTRYGSKAPVAQPQASPRPGRAMIAPQQQQPLTQLSRTRNNMPLLIIG